MSTVITALNVAYDRKDSRGFLRGRLVVHRERVGRVAGAGSILRMD